MKIIGVLCAVVAMYAQDTRPAVLIGRVLDLSGAAVPGAQVQLNSFAAIADGQGRYRLAVPDGTYDVAVTAGGFETFVRQGVVLRPGETVMLDVSLTVAALIERIVVAAKAPDNVRESLPMQAVQESSARDVGEALSRLEGLWKIRKGGIANDVVLRGFQQDNLNVLVDGVRLYGACPNNMDPPPFHVDFAEVEEVEVSKGAFDIRNQGSLGGSIHILSKAPSAGLRITPSLSLGSFGYYNPSITGSVAREKFFALAGYSLRRSQPYHDGNGQPFTAYTNYVGRPDNAFDVNTAWFKTGLMPARGHRLELAYTRQRAGQVLYPYLMMDAGFDNADRASVSYRAGRILAQSYFTEVKHWMTDELRASAVGAPRPYGMATLAGSKVLGGRVEAEFSSGVVGFETYRRNWNAVNTMRMGSRYMDQPSVPDVNLTVAGAYGEYRRTLAEKLRITAGARMDVGDSRARSASLDTSLFSTYQNTRSAAHNDHTLAGHVSAVYGLSSDLEMFAAIGQSARLPDPQERYFNLMRMGSNWVGNPNLRPPQNTEADLGIQYRGRRLALRPTVYFSRLPDYIVVNALSGARSYANVDARMYGGEVSGSMALSSSLLLSGGVSYSRGSKDVQPGRRIFDSNLAEMPPLKSRLSLRYTARAFFAELEGLGMHAQNRVDSDLKEQRTPGYAIMNARAGMQSRKVKLALGLDNLFDRFYYEHLSFLRDPFRSGVRVPEPGRSAYLAISYAF